MARPTAILATAGPIVGALLVVSSGAPVRMLAPLLAIAASVFLLVDRRARSVLLALVLLVLAALSIPPAFDSFIVRGVELNLFGTYAPAYLVALPLLVACAAVLAELEDLDDAWPAYVGFAAALGAILLVFLQPETVGSFSRLQVALPALLLALAAIVPAVWLLRLPPPRPRSGKA